MATLKFRKKDDGNLWRRLIGGKKMPLSRCKKRRFQPTARSEKTGKKKGGAVRREDDWEEVGSIHSLLAGWRKGLLISTKKRTADHL